MSPRHRVVPLDFVKHQLTRLYSARRVETLSPAALSRAMSAHNTAVNRLKYMLVHTMGAPQAFEFRRRELAELKGVDDADTVSCQRSSPVCRGVPLLVTLASMSVCACRAVPGGVLCLQVSDKEVLDSFLRSALDKDGVVQEYLRLGQLAACVGNTIFVHGAIHSINKGFLPSPDNVDAIQTPVPGTDTAATLRVQEWVAALNAWAHQSVLQWQRQPEWNAQHTVRGGHALRGYCYKPSMLGRSITVETMFTDPAGHNHANPQPRAADVVEYLRRSNIQRVVVGHKPFGSTPTLLRQHHVEAVTTDTSYSDSTALDTRGHAVSEVCIQGSPHHNRVVYHGILKDGTRYTTAAPCRVAGGAACDCANDAGAGGGGVGDPLVGMRTADGWLVVATVPAGGDTGYLLRRGQPGHIVQERVVSRGDQALRTAALLPTPS